MLRRIELTKSKDNRVGGNLKFLYNNSHSPSRRSAYINIYLTSLQVSWQNWVLYIFTLGLTASFQGTSPCAHKFWFDLRFHLPIHPYPPPVCTRKTHSHDFEMTACQVITFSDWGSQCFSLSLEKQEEKFNSQLCCIICSWWESHGHCQIFANGF